jgi:predicted DNA-binding helix-hairpin-helix protein
MARFTDSNPGRVLALHGGRDFTTSQFDLAAQARRQPGSLFKTFAAAAALEAGATPDTDRSLLGTIRRLQAAGGVHHPHFSAFRPISNTPMEAAPAAPALREHRLYQAAYLLGQYGFEPEEVVYGAGGNLPLEVDPKTSWALNHPERFPLEITTASYEELVRVPGIGPLAARRIVSERVEAALRSLRDLRKLGVLTTRAAGFLLLRGRRLQNVRWTQQLGFWAPEDDVGAPHVVYQVSPGTFR